MAQHYGLPTRLLDWTSNPSVALYFATESYEQEDGVIYYVPHVVMDDYEMLDPRTADFIISAPEAAKVFAIQPEQGNVVFVRPSYKDERYLNQRSVFSCPANPAAPLNIARLDKVIFRGAWKEEIRRRLRAMGISSSFVYPGLAGVAKEALQAEFFPYSSALSEFGRGV